MSHRPSLVFFVAVLKEKRSASSQPLQFGLFAAQQQQQQLNASSLLMYVHGDRRGQQEVQSVDIFERVPVKRPPCLCCIDAEFPSVTCMQANFSQCSNALFKLPYKADF